MWKGYSPLGENSTSVHEWVAGPQEPLLKLSITMQQNPLLGFTIYLAAGRSGVLISRLLCLLGKLKVSPFLVHLTASMPIRYWFNFVFHNCSHLHWMSQAVHTPNLRTTSNHQEGGNQESPSTNELCIKLIKEFMDGKISKDEAI